MLFLALGTDEHNHPFSLEGWYIVGLAIFLQIGGESREQKLSLFLEDDRASAEEDIGLHLVTLFKELLGMFEFEVVIVVIGLRAETDLLHLLFFLVSFRFFLFFLLCVEEFLVINDPAYRRVRRSSYLDEVEILLIRDAHSLTEVIDTGFYIVANKAHLLDTADLVVDTMRVLFDNSATAWPLRNCCYSFSI